MSPCLDEETILAFGRGTVQGSARTPIEEHVAECDECRSLVSAVARGSLLDPVELMGEGGSPRPPSARGPGGSFPIELALPSPSAPSPPPVAPGSPVAVDLRPATASPTRPAPTSPTEPVAPARPTTTRGKTEPIPRAFADAASSGRTALGTTSGEALASVLGSAVAARSQEAPQRPRVGLWVVGFGIVLLALGILVQLSRG